VIACCRGVLSLCAFAPEAAIVLTAFVMFVIMAVTTDTRAVGAAAAIAIGRGVALDAIFGGYRRVPLQATKPDALRAAQEGAAAWERR
jgi:hypothetical protein